MRIEKLTKDKIKVTLTTTDLVNLNIDIDSLEPDSKELHTFLFHIMETIREKTGFNPYSGQVVVEATPSNDGMCILISRINNMSKKISRKQFNRVSAVRAKEKATEINHVFYFDNFEDLCSALKETDKNSLKTACLYQLNNTYCFIIKHEVEHVACLSVMCEFSAKHTAYSMQPKYINEHGILVAKGVQLVNMAENLRQLK